MSAVQLVRSQLDSASCWAILATMAFPEAEQRAELLDAGVTEHRVNTLYPGSYEHFTGQIMAAIEDHGTDHLGKKAIAANEWRQLIALAQLGQVTIDRGGFNFGTQWNLGKAAFISDAVYDELREHHALQLANNANTAYNWIVFGTYWLSLHPDLKSQMKAGEPDALAQWMINRLLPQEMFA